MLVQQILNSKNVPGVLTVSPELTVADAVQFLAEKRVGAAVVSSDGVTPLGILSERDIVRELGRRGATVLQARITDIMTRKLITCSVSDTSDSVLEKMTEGRFRHLPVMKGDRMIGLISIGDVVKARLGELAMEKDALEGMIKGF